jgi:hypothetical protein
MILEKLFTTYAVRVNLIIFTRENQGKSLKTRVNNETVITETPEKNVDRKAFLGYIANSKETSAWVKGRR